MIIEAREGVITMKIICPNCKIGSRYSVSFIEDAIHEKKPIVCVACEKRFTVETAPKSPFKHPDILSGSRK